MSNHFCAVEGCDRDYHCKGFCRLHYRRFHKHGDPYIVKPAVRPKYVGRKPVADRFFEKVEKVDSGCWEWKAHRNVTGYGRFFVEVRDGKHIISLAHRWSYEYAHGPITPGKHIDHICHNPGCVNPRHLREATNQENIQNRKGPNSNSTTGYWGVSHSTAPGRFRAYINTPAGQLNLGVYDSAEEAAKVAADARDKHFNLPALEVASS